jgi:4-hydroxy-tetrahydrodipicolinate reductase
MKMIRIGIIGAAGRLGGEILHLALIDPSFLVTGAYVRAGSASDGRHVKDSLFFSHDLLAKESDLYLDVSMPHALRQNVSAAMQAKRPLVVGTTGLMQADWELLQQASKSIPIFYTPNFSLGMALLRKWAAEAAALFDPEAVIELTETHHTKKKDAPGGSALLLAKTVEENHPTKKKVAIRSIREGEVIGEHVLNFKAAEEEVGLLHKACTREVFAKGALTAARFLVGQSPGMYGMEDVLYASIPPAPSHLRGFRG